MKCRHCRNCKKKNYSFKGKASGKPDSEVTQGDKDVELPPEFHSSCTCIISSLGVFRGLISVISKGVFLTFGECTSPDF